MDAVSARVAVIHGKQGRRPLLLWRLYIDFEVAIGDNDRCQSVIYRALQVLTDSCFSSLFSPEALALSPPSLSLLALSLIIDWQAYPSAKKLYLDAARAKPGLLQEVLSSISAVFRQCFCA